MGLEDIFESNFKRKATEREREQRAHREESFGFQAILPKKKLEVGLKLVSFAAGNLISLAFSLGSLYLFLELGPLAHNESTLGLKTGGEEIETESKRREDAPVEKKEKQKRVGSCACCLQEIFFGEKQKTRTFLLLFLLLLRCCYYLERRSCVLACSLCSLKQSK